MENALEGVVVCTPTWRVSLCCFLFFIPLPLSIGMDAYIHLWGKVTGPLLWPNAPAFLLPDWLPLLASWSLVGHWLTTTPGLQ